jgi:NDP-sugar pyrophosphorylase family protein
MDRDLPEAALILAGGLGTRLKPLTDKIPKPLIKICGKPTIAHIIDEIERNGIKKIYISVGYKAGMIEDYLIDYDTSTSIKFICENSILGTGGAMKFALKRIPYKDIFMTYGDDLFKLNIMRMYTLHKSYNGKITMYVKRAINNNELSSSGVVGLNKNRVIGFVEKPEPAEAPSRFINVGKYIISRDISMYFPKRSKFSFEQDFLQKVIKKIRVYVYRESSVWYPTDTPERLAIARSKW